MNRRTIALVAAVVAVVGGMSSVWGASGTWSGGAGDGLWGSGGNWDTVPGASDGSVVSADVATFTGSPASTSVTVDLNRNVGGLIFDNTTIPFTVGSTDGNPLYLSNGGAILATSSVNIGLDPETDTVPPELVASPILLAGPTYTFTSNAPVGIPLRFTGAISPNSASPTTLTLNGSNSAGQTSGITSQIDGALTDGASKLAVVKEGTGGWQIETAAGTNTYSGDTIVNGGILRFTTLASMSPNSHVIVNNGGNYRVSVVGGTVPGITINLGGRVSVSTAASTTINIKAESGPALLLNYAGGSGNIVNIPISLTGTTPLQGGVTLIADSLTTQTEIGATNSPFDVGSVMRPFDIGKGASTNTTWDLRIRGPLGGAGGILKKGEGILRIDNASNPFTGIFQVQQGELRFNNNNPFTGATLPEMIVDGGTYRVLSNFTQTFRAVTMTKGSILGSDATSVVKAPAFAFNVAAGDTATADAVLADASSSAVVIKTGPGVGVLSEANTYTGATTVVAGRLVLMGSGARDNVLNGAGVNIQSGGSVSFDYDGANGGGTVQGQIASLLAGGYAGGFSAGAIRSSTATATRGLGWYDDGNAVIVMATYYGDLNLDGKVNGDDYALIDRGRAAGLTGWVNGDINYDGLVTTADYLIMDTVYGTSGVAHEAFMALVAEREAEFGEGYVIQLMANVPEPGGVAGVAGVLMLAGRRRR